MSNKSTDENIAAPYETEDGAKQTALDYAKRRRAMMTTTYGKSD